MNTLLCSTLWRNISWTFSECPVSWLLPRNLAPNLVVLLRSDSLDRDKDYQWLAPIWLRFMSVYASSLWLVSSPVWDRWPKSFWYFNSQTFWDFADSEKSSLAKAKVTVPRPDGETSGSNKLNAKHKLKIYSPTFLTCLLQAPTISRPRVRQGFSVKWWHEIQCRSFSMSSQRH